MKLYHADGGALILVSHDLSHLRLSCTRIIRIHEGCIVADGDRETESGR